MGIKYDILTSANMRKLAPGAYLVEHGIRYEKLKNGDGRFRVEFKVDGLHVKRVIGKESEGVTRTKAESFIEQARTDARHGRLSLPKGRKVALHFEHAADMYIDKLKTINGKSIPKKTERLNLHLKPFFKGKPLDRLCSLDLERYKKHRQDEKAAPGTINCELAVLSHLINSAMDWGWIHAKPVNVKRVKDDAGRITYLTAPQIKDLLEASKTIPFMHLFCMIALGTSLRRAPILRIRVEDIDIPRRRIYIEKDKPGAHVQPITDRLAVFLQTYLETEHPKDREYLFYSDTCKEGWRYWIDEDFAAAVKAANLEDVTPHTLRHTVITHLVQSGVDIPTVQRISSHKTPQMVFRYSHQNGEHIQAAMSSLEGRF